MEEQRERVEALLEKAESAYDSLDWRNTTLSSSNSPTITAKSEGGVFLEIVELDKSYMMQIARSSSLETVAIAIEKDLSKLLPNSLLSMKSKVDSRADDNDKLLKEYEELLSLTGLEGEVERISDTVTVEARELKLGDKIVAAESDNFATGFVRGLECLRVRLMDGEFDFYRMSIKLSDCELIVWPDSEFEIERRES